MMPSRGYYQEEISAAAIGRREADAMAVFMPGTTFKTRGRVPVVCTVVDVLKTYNLAGEMVDIRYVATHDFMGQTITDKTITHTTIRMGLIHREVD